MQSELSEIHNPQESLRWLGGGIMSLGKAWCNHVIYGWNENEKEPSAVKTPGPIAITLGILALVAFFTMPSVHEGFSAVVNAWPPYNNRHATDYRRMAQEAETRGDAKTLAFLSTRMDSLAENVRLKNKAVELDPSLTWIYFRGGDTRYAYNSIPEKHGWMQKLEASDPDNAVPYLTAASIRDTEIRKQFNGLPPAGTITNDPAWRAAMEKAFAAPRYDSYYFRAMDLQQSVLKTHNMQQPEDVGRGIIEYYPSGLWESQAYSKLLMDQAKEAQQKGDTARALHLGWTLAQFAERARANSHNDWARGSAESMLQSACKFLQPLESSEGHVDVAKHLASENEALTQKLAEKNAATIPYVFRPLNATSIALHSAGAGLILFGGAIVLSLVFLFVARFSPSLRGSGFYRWACNCGRFAPAGFAAAIALMAATFAPYLEYEHDYVRGAKDTATLQAIITMDTSLYDLPSRFLHQVGVGLLWEGLIPVAVVAGILFLSRNELFRRAPRVKVA
jgi:hypothetical protein